MVCSAPHLMLLLDFLGGLWKQDLANFRAKCTTKSGHGGERIALTLYSFHIYFSQREREFWLPNSSHWQHSGHRGTSHKAAAPLTIAYRDHR